MKNIFLVLIAILAFTACSGDDDNSSSLETLNQTEWEFTAGNTNYSIYFATVGSTVTITNSGNHIAGNYTYNNPTVNMDYTDECSDTAYVFSACEITGNINGNEFRIIDNGEEYIFYRINE